MDGLPPILRVRELDRLRPHILYVDDFDEEPAPMPLKEPDPPAIEAPRLTMEDVLAAREQGRLQGIEEARTDHEAIQEALRIAALTQIADAFDSAKSLAESVARHRMDEIGRTILTFLLACLPKLASSLSRSEALALLRDLTPDIPATLQLVIHAPPGIADFLKREVSAAKVIADDKLAPQDLHVAWEAGEARRDWRRIWDAVRGALAPCNLPSLDEIVKDFHHGC